LRVSTRCSPATGTDDDVPVLTGPWSPGPEIRRSARGSRQASGRCWAALAELDRTRNSGTQLAALFEQSLRGLRELADVRELVRAAVLDAVQRELALRRKPEDAAQPGRT
jgi:hypothetical protein